MKNYHLNKRRVIDVQNDFNKSLVKYGVYSVLCMDCDQHYFDSHYKCWCCNLPRCIYDNKENHIYKRIDK